jgi:hypothetical protein
MKAKTKGKGDIMPKPPFSHTAVYADIVQNRLGRYRGESVGDKIVLYDMGSGRKFIAEVGNLRAAEQDKNDPNVWYTSNPRRARTVSGRIRELVREGKPDGHGQAGAIAYREMRSGDIRRNPRQKRGRIAAVRGDFFISVWEERDRLHIGLKLAKRSREQRATQTYRPDESVDIADWWDDEARQMFEDGFFDAKRLEDSVVEYAESVGLIEVL